MTTSKNKTMLYFHVPSSLNDIFLQYDHNDVRCGRFGTGLGIRARKRDHTWM